MVGQLLVAVRAWSATSACLRAQCERLFFSSSQHDALIESSHPARSRWPPALEHARDRRRMECRTCRARGRTPLHAFGCVIQTVSDRRAVGSFSRAQHVQTREFRRILGSLRCASSKYAGTVITARPVRRQRRRRRVAQPLRIPPRLRTALRAQRRVRIAACLQSHKTIRQTADVANVFRPRPMKRFTDTMVLTGLRSARLRRLADVTCRRPHSAPPKQHCAAIVVVEHTLMRCATVATSELVVPRSMPTPACADAARWKDRVRKSVGEPSGVYCVVSGMYLFRSFS